MSGFGCRVQPNRWWRAGCLRDAAPDAWGRRVILHRVLGSKGRDADVDALDELTYLLASGSDRIGALDFQVSATHYQPRKAQGGSLEARPKAMIEDGNRKLIAKFSSSTGT